MAADDEATVFDLSGPPSRAEAGLREGRSHAVYEHADKEPFRVRVILPGHRELTLDARLVGFDSLDSPDPPTGPPTTMDIHHYPATLDAGREHLRAAAKQFHLDAGAIEAWYEAATSTRPSDAHSTVRTPWLSSDAGFLRVRVQGRFSPPVDTADPGQTVVHYALYWDALA